MDIYAYAMEMEQDGERYYREAASQAKSEGIRNILTMLADAEVRHYETFRRMKDSEAVVVPHLGYLSGIKTIFAELSEKKEPMSNGSQVDLYRKAQELEEKTRDFYREQSGAVPADQKDVLNRIANEEQKHYDILENLIIMVLRPETWLENAEWYRLEEY